MVETNQIGIATLGQQAEVAKALTAQQYAGARESAQSIVRSEMNKHEKEAAAWRWLDAAMVAHSPTKEEEVALWDLFCRARRERF
jgi:hypothetical protein